MRLFDRLLFEKIAPLQIRHLGRPDYNQATGLAREAIAQMDADFLVGPPVMLHLPNPDLLAGVWSAGRECLAADREGRPARELVAAAVSRLNACPYCEDIHMAMLHSFRASTNPTPAATWAMTTLTPGAPPYSGTDAPQILGTAVFFHYLNRMVNVFLDASPIPLGGWFKNPLVRLSGNLLRPRLASRNAQPGRFLTPAPSIALPPEFAWAAANANIAGGFLRFAAAAEQAGAESVHPAVRELVASHLSAWKGEPAPLSRQWVNDLTPDPAARLALLTARASYQVDDEVIAAFRAQQSSSQSASDRDLINLTSWASYSAARRIASWLTLPEAI